MKTIETYAETLSPASLQEVDPFVAQLIGLEEIRQRRKLILIPSESICPPPVREALASPFTNLYAEGYPPRFMDGAREADLEDLEWQLVHYRRYADRRFYKGCDYVHEVEALAKRRVAESFATPACPADRLHVNVQPLSGAAANNAVYEAFMEPGETLMGMSLPHGGHLTHGSELNRSGKRYRVISYGVNPDSERLDYEKIRRLAREHRPKVIVAGYTSYPWAPDWNLFREIADEAGAILLADIAHPAGLVVAGLYPSPVGIADVITFTTHKTLCGPRGAVILTSDPLKAQKVDAAVFPGEQGGPHINKIAAMAVTFQIARTEAFRDLQSRIVTNARALAHALEKRGVRICYGGTDTHLLVVDLRKLGRRTGYPLMGEIAARILDLAGIVVNKNTIPGDESATDARGIRLGTPWASQRGMGPEEMEAIAGIIQRILSEIHPFTYYGVTALLPRGKLPLEVLEQARSDVQDLLARREPEAPPWGYPHDSGYEPSPATPAPVLEAAKAGEAAGPPGAGVWLEDFTDMGVLEVRGERAWAFLQEVGTRDLTALSPGEGRETILLDREARYFDRVTVLRADAETFFVLTDRAKCADVCVWFRRLAEGYVLFDPEDILVKVQGPFRVWEQSGSKVADRKDRLAAIRATGAGALALWEGESGVQAFRFEGEDRWILMMSPEEARRLWDAWGRDERVAQIDAAARHRLEQAEGWPAAERPEARALLQARAKLFDLEKPYFIGLWALRDACPSRPMKRFVPPAPPAEVRRSRLHAEHVSRAKKMAAFAGWEMPIWYQSIQEEHRAVRTTAGLFDLSHMGVVGVEGEDAAHFLDLVTTNYVRWLRPGESQYGFLLDPEGQILDDLMVYRTGPRGYFLVVNAANAEKDLAWLTAVARGEASLDLDRPGVRFRGAVKILDLKSPEAGARAMVNLALQGPVSLNVLLRLAARDEDARSLRAQKKTEVVRIRLGDVPVWASRTGYTGEPVGFELLVHPDQVTQIWRRLLEAGEDFGVVPAGLGARDSLRTEAGLPLYGHELAGPQEIDPLEAGFAGYVKLHKPFFVGRRAMLEASKGIRRQVVRFKLAQRGARMHHPDDLVIHRRTQQFMGRVTSAAPDGEGIQVGMAVVEERFARPQTPIGVVPQIREGAADPSALGPGSHWPLHDEGVVLDRFPMLE